MVKELSNDMSGTHLPVRSLEVLVPSIHTTRRPEDIGLGWALPSAFQTACFSNEKTSSRKTKNGSGAKKSQAVLLLGAPRFTPETHRNRTPIKESGPRADAEDSRRGVALRKTSKINCYSEQRPIWSTIDRRRRRN